LISKEEYEESIERALQALAGCNMIVALLGAPNTGKSSLFNVLTGSNVTVANWPGVTVDINIGRLRWDKQVCIVDLPGSYGLVPTSPEEKVTREALLALRPYLVIVTLDSTQPEASINLVIQAVEAFPHKVLVAATKAAVSHAHGVHIDYEKLSHLLGAPVIPVSPLEGVGIDSLVEAIRSFVGSRGLRIDYGILEPLIHELEQRSDTQAAASDFDVSPRWIAVQLVGGDRDLAGFLAANGYEGIAQAGMEAYEEASRRAGMPPELLIAEHRISLAERIIGECVVRREPAAGVWQRLVDLFLHPIAGPVLSVLGLFATFAVIFAVNTGFPLNLLLRAAGLEGAALLVEKYNLSSILQALFSYLAGVARASLSPPLGDLVADGIIGGVGFVVSFVPLIAMVYVSLAILEDSGLAARMAVSFHPLLYRFGLSGRSIFPLLMGIGCNVPAVYATRALSEEERLRAVFAVPFIPCQARLAVLIAFVAALIDGFLAQSLTMILVYLEALAAALLTSVIVARLVQPRLYGEINEFFERKPELIMELPPVHRPHWRVIWWQVRDNTIHFLRKAGTIIFLLAILTWALLSYGPMGYTSDPRSSWGWLVGEVVGDIVHVVGIGEEKDEVFGIALVNGLVAKEGVLTALAIALGYGEEDVARAIEGLGITTAQTIGFLVLISLYFPCIATLSAIRGITRSWRVTVAYAAYTLLVALVFASLTYRVVSLVAG